MTPKLKISLAAAGLAMLGAGMVWLATHRGPFAPVEVRLAEAREAALRDSVFGVGTVEARYAYAIGPTQAGRVLKVHADHGDTVKAGQVLAEIDPVDLQQRLAGAAAAQERARHAVSTAEAQQREAESRHRVAHANVQRYRELARRNFVSREAVDIRENDAAVTAAALEAAQSALRAARMDAERASHDREALVRQLGNLKLASPVDGIVVARDAEPGNTVVAGQTVVRVVDPRSLWVRARVDQARGGGVVPGLPADIVLRSAQGTVYAGRVERVDIQGDAVTEEKIVNVAFAQAGAPLALGELAEVTVRLAEIPRALTVPSAAVKVIEGRHGVWRVAGGKATWRAVTIGRQTLDGLTEIRDGLGAGDTVIAHSSAALQEDTPVRVVGQP